VFADVEIEARKRAFLSEPAAAHAASVVARLDLCRDTSKTCARVRSCPNRLARATAAPHCVHECIPSALGVPAESTGLCADPSGAFSIVGRHASRRRPFALFPYPRLEWFSSSGPRLLPESEPVLRGYRPVRSRLGYRRDEEIRQSLKLRVSRLCGVRVARDIGAPNIGRAFGCRVMRALGSNTKPV
jgi:hypothetical protein